MKYFIWYSKPLIFPYAHIVFSPFLGVVCPALCILTIPPKGYNINKYFLIIRLIFVHYIFVKTLAIIPLLWYNTDTMKGAETSEERKETVMIELILIVASAVAVYLLGLPVVNAVHEERKGEQK